MSTNIEALQSKLINQLVSVIRAFSVYAMPEKIRQEALLEALNIIDSKAAQNVRNRVPPLSKKELLIEITKSNRKLINSMHNMDNFNKWASTEELNESKITEAINIIKNHGIDNLYDLTLSKTIQQQEEENKINEKQKILNKKLEKLKIIEELIIVMEVNTTEKENELVKKENELSNKEKALKIRQEIYDLEMMVENKNNNIKSIYPKPSE